MTQSAPGAIRKTARSRVLVAGITPVLLIAAVAAAPPARAKSEAAELLQYLSPLPEKTYLNEAQDRLIKKKKFKVGDLPDVQPVLNREVGFFALLSPEQSSNQALWNELLAQEEVNGLSVTLPWRVLEPQEEEYNWQPVDALLKAVKQHNKELILRVSTCGLDIDGQSDSPAWVLDSNIKKVSYNGFDGKTYSMPIFWDTNYLAKWNNFIKDMGERYDKNPSIHSIGITGGGVRGGTFVIPQVGSTAPENQKATKEANDQLEQTLKKEYGLNQRQIVEHWKYVADLFPQAFPTARLNFNIDGPIRGRAGQDALDEISDYLSYRYGQRVFLTRQNVSDDKHGFDQYRVLLKFHPDTFTGYQLASGIKAQEFQKLCQNALEDGISFAEIPVEILKSNDDLVKKPLRHLLSHIGYQIVSEKVSIPAELPSGDPLKASFTFKNLGAAAPMRAERAFDKDVSTSFKVQLELRDSTGKAVVLSLHTPAVPTHRWTAGTPLTWSEELRMPVGEQALKPGVYSVFLSVVDAETNRKVAFLNGLAGGKPSVNLSAPVGTLKVVPGNQTVGSSQANPQ